MITFNIPLSLTFIRLALSPIVLPFFLALYLPANNLMTNCMLAAFFLLFGLTDMLDGFFARRLNQVTDLGKLLDPIADKFMVYSTLITLVYVQKLYFYWAIIIIGREFFVMMLREIALFYRFTVPVAQIGKIKTAFQMMFITWVIINPAQSMGSQAPVWNGIETILLICTLVFTIASAVWYYHDFCNRFKQIKHH
jgi:CDP-diacylglycerol--glycerol-3-phosphate 3-phosphatidyltransferase